MTIDALSTVQADLPLSRSFVWDLQCKFYESLGIDAWLSGVIPSKVTTNSFIARTYAQMIVNYVADLNLDEITIIELGAGHGRFGFLCAQHLQEMSSSGLLNNLKWKYVLTDVAERNIQFWDQHPAFQSLVRAGRVDFARFDVGNDHSIRLNKSEQVIDQDHPHENLVVIANYFFDSLPIDVWQVEDGQLFECRPVFRSKPEATCFDTGDVAILEQVDLDWQRVPASNSHYSRPDLDRVVEYFRDKIGDGTFTLPISAFELTSQLETWSKNGCLVLTSDKGYIRENDLINRSFPTMVHHGCFSFSVNFCAFRRWFENRGGSSFLPLSLDPFVEFCAFTTHPVEKVPRFNFAYREHAARFSPGNFHQLIRRCGRDASNQNLNYCMSAIRLSCYECDVFYDLRYALREFIEDANSEEIEDVRTMLRCVEANFFQLGPVDILFEIGLLYQRISDFEDAVDIYLKSTVCFGSHPVTLYNIAICHRECKRYSEALHYCRKSLELDPADEEGIALLKELESLC